MSCIDREFPQCIDYKLRENQTSRGFKAGLQSVIDGADTDHGYFS